MYADPVDWTTGLDIVRRLTSPTIEEDEDKIDPRNPYNIPNHQTMRRRYQVRDGAALT